MANATLQNEALLLRFQAIAEETRFRVVQLLADGERCVCELQDDIGADLIDAAKASNMGS